MFSVTRLGNFLKPLATINLPKSPTCLGNFWQGVKINHFLVKSFLGIFYRHLAIFSGHPASDLSFFHSISLCLFLPILLSSSLHTWEAVVRIIISRELPVKGHAAIKITDWKSYLVRENAPSFSPARKRPSLFLVNRSEAFLNNMRNRLMRTLIFPKESTATGWAIIACGQCDQIWRNFATLVKCQKTLAIFWGLNICHSFKPTLAIFKNTNKQI